MNYKQFVEAVKLGLIGQVGSDREVILKRNLKNNDIEKVGVIIKGKEEQLVPTIYLEEYFQMYSQGKSIEEIVDDIILLSATAKVPDIEFLNNIEEFEVVKNKIMCKVINKEYNKEFLEDVPHKEVLDWAITYYLLIDITQEGCISTKVSYDLLKRWEISEEELYEIAMENTSTTFPYKVRAISEMIFCNNMEELKAITDKEDLMYSISNDHLHYGAVSILDEKLQNVLFEKLGGDYFIFPSSVHDVIVSSTKYLQEKEALLDMVKEGNLCIDAPEDLLSYHVYQYSKKRGLEILY